MQAHVENHRKWIIIPLWETLFRVRRLNVHAIAKWSIFLIPLLASADLVSQRHLNISFPMPVNLVMTYLSSILFLISSLFVDLFCPDIIKDHKTFDIFFRFVVQNSELVANLRRKSSAYRDSLLEKLASEFTHSTTELENVTPSLLKDFISEGVAKALLDDVEPAWKRGNHRWFPVRVITILGFVLSALGGLYISFYDAPVRVFKALAQMQSWNL